MKKFFIPVQMEIKLNLDEILKICKRKKVSVCSPIQYIEEARKVEKFLKKNGIRVLSSKCLTTGEYNQVLGCDVSACHKDSDIYLYLGDGKFHPIWIAYKTNKPTFIIGEQIKEVNKKEVESLRNYIRYSKLKLIESKVVGVIVSLKPGQNRIKLANELKKKFKDKEVYVFLMDNVDPNELNDFNVDIWINTACPRLIDEREKFLKPIINVGEIL